MTYKVDRLRRSITAQRWAEHRCIECGDDLPVARKNRKCRACLRAETLRRWALPDRRCSGCSEPIPSGRTNNYCPACTTKNNRKYSEANTRCSRCGDEIPAERRSRWCSACTRRHARDYHCRATFGITTEQYQALLDSQGGVCAICERPETTKDRTGRISSLAVDHCHETGDVRGLLCRGCNTAIGSLRESPALLVAAIAYLERGPA